MDTMVNLIISFTCGALIGLTIGGKLYQRDLRRQQDWDRALEKGTVSIREENIPTLHWMATSGFRRLLFGGGFQIREDAERAHNVLDSLGALFPAKDSLPADESFDRMGNISMIFPDGPLSKPNQLVRERWEVEERSRKELEKKIYERHRKSGSNST